MYSTRNFDGRNDANLWEVIDNGEIVEASGGNWDLIKYNGMIYYLAKINTTAASGTWGTPEHFRKHQRESLERATRRYNEQIKEA